MAAGGIQEQQQLFLSYSLKVVQGNCEISFNNAKANNRMHDGTYFSTDFGLCNTKDTVEINASYKRGSQEPRQNLNRTMKLSRFNTIKVHKFLLNQENERPWHFQIKCGHNRVAFDINLKPQYSIGGRSYSAPTVIGQAEADMVDNEPANAIGEQEDKKPMYLSTPIRDSNFYVMLSTTREYVNMRNGIHHQTYEGAEIGHVKTNDKVTVSATFKDAHGYDSTPDDWNFSMHNLDTLQQHPFVITPGTVTIHLKIQLGDEEAIKLDLSTEGDWRHRGRAFSEDTFPGP